MTDRKAFEAEFPIPNSVQWDDGDYKFKQFPTPDNMAEVMEFSRIIGAWQVWQARGMREGRNIDNLVEALLEAETAEQIIGCRDELLTAWMGQQARGAQQDPVARIVEDPTGGKHPLMMWTNGIPPVGTELFTSPPSRPDSVLAAVIKRLETRLEVSPDHPYDAYDGIASRDETIKLLTTELSAVTAERDALANAEWLTTAHMICTDAGIEQGHIAERMKQLRDKWDALRRDAERWKYWKPRMIAADFEWGQFKEPVLLFSLNCKVSADIDKSTDEAIAATGSDTKGETK